MKVALLAGGRGQRIGAESKGRPKPMLEIGGIPLISHVMSIYGHFGHSDFVIALGHRCDDMVDHFLQSPHWYGATLELPDGRVVQRPGQGPGWHIQLIDTGCDTLSAGRIRQLRPFVGNDTFMLSWCDGVGDIDIPALVDFHRGCKKTATLTAVHPPPRFGRLELEGNQVAVFDEKGPLQGEWINGAFFVLEPSVFDLVSMPDDMQFEDAPLRQLAASGELMAFRHESFWRCVDTDGERDALDRLWRTGDAPWPLRMGNDAYINHRT